MNSSSNFSDVDTERRDGPTLTRAFLSASTDGSSEFGIQVGWNTAFAT